CGRVRRQRARRHRMRPFVHGLVARHLRRARHGRQTLPVRMGAGWAARPRRISRRGTVLVRTPSLSRARGHLAQSSPRGAGQTASATNVKVTNGTSEPLPTLAVGTTEVSGTVQVAEKTPFRARLEMCNGCTGTSVFHPTPRPIVIEFIAGSAGREPLRGLARG